MNRVYGRRADGQGSVDLGRFQNADEAEHVRDGTFATDHSLTMCWVLDGRGRLRGNVLLRDPPGMSATPTEQVNT